MSSCHILYSLSKRSWPLTWLAHHRDMPDETPAMPLSDAHFGGFFVSGIGLAAPYLQEVSENTREGVRA